MAGYDTIADEIVQELYAPGWTGKQRRFAVSYLRHLNASRAWREATGDKDIVSSGGYGSKVLELPHVATFIREQEQSALKRRLVDREHVLDEIAKCAFFNLGDIMVIHDDGTSSVDLTLAGEAQFAGLAEVKVTEKVGGERETVVKGHSKLGALDTLAKHLKLIGAEVEVNIRQDLADRIVEARRKFEAEREG